MKFAFAKMQNDCRMFMEDYLRLATSDDLATAPKQMRSAQSCGNFFSKQNKIKRWFKDEF